MHAEEDKKLCLVVPHIHGETKDPQALVHVKCLSHFQLVVERRIISSWYDTNDLFCKRKVYRISKIRQQQTVHFSGVKHVDLFIGIQVSNFSKAYCRKFLLVVVTYIPV
jgi:hypothetical protein